MVLLFFQFTSDRTVEKINKNETERTRGGRKEVESKGF
jgi:hypothetical protein